MYKESRAGDTLADRAAKSTLQGIGYQPFVPGRAVSSGLGSDERQYCSPGL